MKLRARILLVALAVVLGVGGLVVFFARGVAEELLSHEIENHLRTTVQARGRLVDTYLRTEKDSLREFAEGPTAQAVLKANKAGAHNAEALNRFRIWMNGYTQGEGAAIEVMLIDDRGKVILSSVPEHDGAVVAETACFKESETEACACGPQLMGDRQGLILTFAAPVHDEVDGSLLGRVAIAQPMMELNAIVGEYEGLGPSGETYILDSTGTMLTPSRTDPNCPPLSIEVESHIFQIGRTLFDDAGQPVAATEVFTYDNYRQIEVIGAYAPVYEMDWIVVAERATHDAFASLRVLQQAMIGILILLGVLAVLFASYLSRTISRPILDLKAGATELANGNLGHTVDDSRSDEIGDLARSFNTMSERLWQARERLEETVAARTAELREANASLDASNKELQDFAYVASHDLREPLRKISSFGHLLAQSMRGRLDDDEQENLGYMVDGATRMQVMIDDLLTYSRVTTQAKRFEKVDLNQTVREIEHLEVAARLEDTGGTIAIRGPLPHVEADASQMRQLFQNLIGNALKFHRTGVPPRVEISSSALDDGTVEISVRDNGIGIPSQYAEQVFAMFKRLHAREEYEGTGIGLAVCKKIVERHGGHISVESSPGEGSTFHITLPAFRQQIDSEEHNGES